MSVGLLVAAGEMAHEEAQFDAVEQAAIGRERLHLLRRQAEPRHASVDLQHGRESKATRLAQRRPAGELFKRIDRRHDGETSRPFFLARLQAIEHINADIIRQHASQRRGLAKLRHEEIAAASRVQHRSRLLDTRP